MKAGSSVAARRVKRGPRLSAEESETVGRNVRGLREVRGVTIRTAADAVGIDYSGLSRMETGARCFRERDVLVLAGLLGVQREVLLSQCSHCGGHPPRGYRCLQCSAAGEA